MTERSAGGRQRQGIEIDRGDLRFGKQIANGFRENSRTCGGIEDCFRMDGGDPLGHQAGDAGWRKKLGEPFAMREWNGDAVSLLGRRAGLQCRVKAGKRVGGMPEFAR